MSGEHGVVDIPRQSIGGNLLEPYVRLVAPGAAAYGYATTQIKVGWVHAMELKQRSEARL
jgi:hypothetical protein